MEWSLRRAVTKTGLSPNHKVSGERVLSSRTREANNRATTTLRLDAMMLGKTDTTLGRVLPPQARPTGRIQGDHGHRPKIGPPDLPAHVNNFSSSQSTCPQSSSSSASCSLEPPPPPDRGAG
jgi:hypothetical protein